MKQHYIPRCYLKRFSGNTKSILTYDKINSKIYNANLMSVCCANDMYTLSDTYIGEHNSQMDNKINELSIEHHHFANFVEPEFTKILRTIDEIKDEWVSGKGEYRLMYAEKKELALHIVTQYLRHPLVQEANVNNYLRFEKAGIDMTKHILSKIHNKPAYNDLEIKVKCEDPALHANLTYLNEDTLMKFANAIASNVWVFLISENSKFYTSDFPIVLYPHVEGSRSIYMGLVQYGGELTFPLSPSLMLVAFDKVYFSHKVNEDCSFIKATYKEVRRQNMLRYFYANQHVFSLQNDFELIECIRKKEGRHVFYKVNLNSEIVTGLGRY